MDTFLIFASNMWKEMSTFKVVMLEEASEFFRALPEKVQDKILSNIKRVAGGERNAEFFKKLEGTAIWEFRTLFGGVAYRLFAFLDTEKETMVVATHGIVKKNEKNAAKGNCKSGGS